MREYPPSPFIIVEQEGQENPRFADADTEGRRRLERRRGLRLRREAMQRDERRRARSWSYVGALSLLAGSLQLAVIWVRLLPSGDPVAIGLPVALLGLALYWAIKLFRKGRRLSHMLNGP